MTLSSCSSSVANITTDRLVNLNLVTSAKAPVSKQGHPHRCGVKTFLDTSSWEHSSAHNRVEPAFVVSPGSRCLTVLQDPWA